MNQITATFGRLEAARTLPDVLGAAYTAFEHILAVVRHHQGHAGGAFPAFVLAAAAAGNGRDNIADAPSLAPIAAPTRPDLMTRTSINDTAYALAKLAALLALRLSAAAALATGPADRSCCEQAAQEAAKISELLGWAHQP